MFSTGSSKCVWNTMRGNNGSIKTSIRLWRLVFLKKYVGKSFFLRLVWFSNRAGMFSFLRLGSLVFQIGLGSPFS